MKLATPSHSNLNCGGGRGATFRKRKAGRPGPTGKGKRCGGFTLAEVLAAMLFLAIVIPVAVEALSVSSLAGEVAARKGAAARIADRVLNESLVMTNWSNGMQNGTISEGALDFQWSLSSQGWSPGGGGAAGLPGSTGPASSGAVPLDLVTAEVKFQAQGKDYSVKLSTLASAPNQPAPNAGPQL